MYKEEEAKAEVMKTRPSWLVKMNGETQKLSSVDLLIVDSKMFSFCY